MASYRPNISPPILVPDEYESAHVVSGPDDIELSPTPDYYFEDPRIHAPQPLPSPSSSSYNLRASDSNRSLPTSNSVFGFGRSDSGHHLRQGSEHALQHRTGYAAPRSPDPTQNKFNWDQELKDERHAVPTMSYGQNDYLKPEPQSRKFPHGPPFGGQRGGTPSSSAGMSKKKKKWIWIGSAIAVVVVLAVAIPVVYVVIHNQQTGKTTTGTGSSKTGTTGAGGSTNTTSGTGGAVTPVNNNIFNPLNPLSVPDPTQLTASSGSDGSTVTTYVNGTKTTFTYRNQFGGSWAADPMHPYNVSGRAQSWVPSLTEEWVWGRDTIRGVNLGGWFVLEPFICPAMFEQYGGSVPGNVNGVGQTVGAVDEWTLSAKMRQDLGDAGFEAAMRYHYETFITEEDFAQIAGAGLNYLRVPLGFWAVDTLASAGEPYLAGVSWEYFVRAVGWARKYGLRILLDLHALEGSQNGWNHSGKSGVVNWMYGIMGIANAQRSLNTIRSFTEFISQEGIKEVVTMMSLVNEVQAPVLGADVIRSFYWQAYQLIRSISGMGSGSGPIIVLHENFQGIAKFAGFLSGADRVAVDQHPYLAFPTPPVVLAWPDAYKAVCSWGGGTNDSQSSFGLTVGGEWSMAINDCGLWLVGVGGTPTYSSISDCAQFDDWRTWDATMKNNIQTMAKANMESLQNWFMWTWKIGNSTKLGYDSAPLWHYKRGLEQGWVPADPRSAAGTCAGVGVGGNSFNGTFPASAIGQAPAYTIAADQSSSYAAFPPASMGGPTPAVAASPTLSFGAAQVSLFPTFTPTGTPVTLATSAVPTGVKAASGWYAPQDTAGAYVTVAGCSYPDYYNATAASLLPTARCTGRA